MPTETTFDDLADEKFVSLTTFRKNGVGVPTPVWIGRDGDALVVTTPVGSGKVKIPVNQKYKLKDAAKAHQDLEGRNTTGSTILVP